MINFPKEITDKALLEQLKPGIIIRTEVQFPDGQKGIKRLIILTKNNINSVLMIATTSKNVGKKYYAKDNIQLSSNKEKVFEKDTSIQLTRVFEKPTFELQNAYNQHRLDILGEISKELLKEIFKRITLSEVIEEKYIIRIKKENKQ